MRGGDPNPFVRARPDLPWFPPGDDPRSRAINGRVWDLATIHAISRSQVEQTERSLIIPITDKCTEDVQKLELTTVDLADRLLRLSDRNYDKSMWCQKSVWPGVRVADEALWCPCDAYQLTVVERASTGWEGPVEYYFKLCISPANAVVLLVSVHL